jgi:uncharacterized membrane protein
MADRGNLDKPRGTAGGPSYDPDTFGRFAERLARYLGTGRYLAIQTGLVIVWIVLNVSAVALRWDAYPFILLNLAFSTQAAYAAPLILLAQTRQAERDKLRDARVQEHHDSDIQREREFEARQTEVLKRERQLAEQHLTLLAQNTRLTEEIARLTAELHATICIDPKPHSVKAG